MYFQCCNVFEWRDWWFIGERQLCFYFIKENMNGSITCSNPYQFDFTGSKIKLLSSSGNLVFYVWDTMWWSSFSFKILREDSFSLVYTLCICRNFKCREIELNAFFNQLEQFNSSSSGPILSYLFPRHTTQNCFVLLSVFLCFVFKYNFISVPYFISSIQL